MVLQSLSKVPLNPLQMHRLHSVNLLLYFEHHEQYECTLFLFLFLQRFVEGVVARIPFLVGKIVGSFLIVVFTIDFLHSLYVEKKEDIPERVWRIKDTLIEKISRS